MPVMGTIKDVMHYFDMSAAEFAREWKLCSEQDKIDLKTGIGNGTLTY
jgi:hypothetical protein